MNQLTNTCLSLTHRHRRLSLVASIVIAASFQHLVAFGQEPADKKPPRQRLIRIAEETTRITEPLDNEGFVDYLQAINDRYSEGITPDNNFEVIVRQVMGTAEISQEFQARYFKVLGIPVPQGPRFYLSYFDYAAGKEKTGANDRDAILAEFDVLLTEAWSADDHPLAVEWLREYGKDLDRLVEGSRRPKFYTPYIAEEVDEEEPVPRLIGLLLPTVQQQRSIARGLCIRANGRIGAGDLNGAWRDIQAMHRIARHVAGGFTLIEGLVGIAIDGMALRAEERLLNSPRLTAAQAGRFLKDLQQLPPLPPLADKIDEGERFMGLDATVTLARYHKKRGFLKMLNLIEALSDASPPSTATVFVVTQPARLGAVNLLIDWNVTLVKLNHWYDRMTAAAREAVAAKRRAAFAEIDQDIKQLVDDVRDARSLLLAFGTKGPRKAAGEKIGDILVALLLPAIRAARNAEDRAQAGRVAMQVAFAAQQFRLQRGTPPPSLQALSPRYIKQLPTDPCSDGPLKYQTDDQGGFLLYSVGVNGQDNGGVGPEEAGGDGDDIVIRVR